MLHFSYSKCTYENVNLYILSNYLLVYIFTVSLDKSMLIRHVFAQNKRLTENVNGVKMAASREANN